MVRLIPLLKRVFFCPKIQREAPSCISPAARLPKFLLRFRRGRRPRRPVYRTPCKPSVGAGFYPARSSAPLVTPRRAGCPHPAAPPHPMLHPVGANASVRPSIPHRTPCKTPLSLRSQCAHWLWQSASPVPSAPLPKGGWHGKAVTGGFRSPRTPCNPRRGRRPRRPVYRAPCTLRRGGVLPRPFFRTPCNPP